MNRETTCCFTGHRPEKLPWREDEGDPRCLELKARLAGAVEAAYEKGMRHFLCGMARGADFYCCEAALALRDQFAPPTIHYEQPDPECDLDYVPNVGREMSMTYALSNSLGFGGHNACLLLRKWEG